MRILLIGANGQLGTELRKILSTGNELVALDQPDVELTDRACIQQAVNRSSPEMIINAAAYNQVDRAEAEVAEAFAVNAFGVRELALAARDRDSVLVHFSTDYVYDGRKGSPYVESDPPAPLSAYGLSKLAGDYFVQALCPRHFLIRTCGLYGPAAASSEILGNFVETMLRLAAQGREIKVVSDQVLTPTSARELANRTAQLTKSEDYGLYHITNRGECSWFEFAREIFARSGVPARLKPTTSKAYGAAAARPPYSVLDNLHLRQVGLDDLRHWREALEEYLADRAG